MINTEPTATLEVYALLAKRYTVELYQKANLFLKDYEPVQIMFIGIIFAISASILLKYLSATVKYCRNLRQNLSITLFNFVIWLPCGRYFLQKEQKKAQDEFRQR